MNRKLRTMTTLTAALVAGATALPAHAQGATVIFQPHHYDATEHLDAGQGFCVPWAFTFHEVRDGGYKIVAPEGGQVTGERHVNGVIDGLIELIPDDPALPTYTGTYREKVNGVITGPELWAESRIAQYRLRSTLDGSDGSTLQLSLSGKLTINAQGRLVVSHDEFTCN